MSRLSVCLPSVALFTFTERLIEGFVHIELQMDLKEEQQNINISSQWLRLLKQNDHSLLWVIEKVITSTVSVLIPVRSTGANLVFV